MENLIICWELSFTWTLILKEINVCLFVAKSCCQHLVIPVTSSVPYTLVLLLLMFTNCYLQLFLHQNHISLNKIKTFHKCFFWWDWVLKEKSLFYSMHKCGDVYTHSRYLWWWLVNKWKALFHWYWNCICKCI